MAKTSRSSPRREDSLSRERIVDAAIELLDGGGEAALTFRALSEALGTGAGAIYWHIADKSDLLTAACDAVVVRTLEACARETSPKATIRAVALGLFDAMDAHAWVGSALMRASGRLPTVRLIERIGQQVRSLGVAEDAQWATVSALLHYIVGVGGQNAANARHAQAHGLVRGDFLDSVARAWEQLPAQEWPFVNAMAGQFAAHDDRGDFLAGIDLLLGGIKAARSRP
jgi:AcrR family transcriptional regulator